MAYIPWGRISSWHCSSCGRCCRFRVFLRPREREELATHFDDKIIGGGQGRPDLKKRNGVCIFKRSVDGFSRCLLQKTGLKPSACRTFPFITSPGPLRRRTSDYSLFEYRGRELHIYANSACPSINLGRPSMDLVQRVLPEVAEISLFGRRDQRATTGHEITQYLELPV